VAAGGNVSTALGSVPYKSNWTHVLFTCTYAGAVVSYANGAVSGAGGNTGSLVNNTTTNAMRIGNYVPATTSTFDGCIRHFKIWNKILSSTEIAADYAGNTPTDSLVCWYKLGGDYANYGSGGAGTGTNSGSVGIIGDGAIAVAVKAQRKGATDKWLCYKGVGGQVGTIEIES
jgi:hypothetical protein